MNLAGTIQYSAIAVTLLIIILTYSLKLQQQNTSHFKFINFQGDSHYFSEVSTINFDNDINNKKLFDLNFEYILNSYPCSNSSEILAIFIVTSYFGNVETRSAMRRAFSINDLKELHIRRVFLLGLAPTDRYMTQNSVVNENERFGDIVQGNFIEAYRNLTYKHIMGLKWVNEYCGNSKYVIKMDDDIVIDVRKVVRLLTQEKEKLPVNNLLAGYVLPNMVPIRDPANKWYVTKNEYLPNTYPQFVSGWFYVTNCGTINKLLQYYLLTKYFWIDDVYVTGILAKKLHIRHYNLNKYFVVHPEFLHCCINDVTKSNTSCDTLIGPNDGNANLFFEFNEVMKVCETIKCNNRSIPLNETCIAERQINLGKGDATISDYKLQG